MINTVTLNPALDYFIETEQLTLGKMNHSSYSYLQAGGKGVNVAIVAKNLGLLSRATGFLGKSYPL